MANVSEKPRKASEIVMDLQFYADALDNTQKQLAENENKGHAILMRDLLREAADRLKKASTISEKAISDEWGLVRKEGACFLRDAIEEGTI